VPSDVYLAYEFGWKPVANDISKFAHAVSNADTVLAQYERDSGRLVRRRYEFPPEVTESVSTHMSGVRPALLPYSSTAMFEGGLPASEVLRVRTEAKQRWFSGAFTYHLPTGSDARSVMARKAMEAKKLLGASLDPDTVWNLTPWSWAVDWFTNTGDIISNLTDMAIDGLVLKYGYMMETKVTTDTYYFRGPNGLKDPSITADPLVLRVTTKIRRKATPFGFGLTWEGFSSRQVAIAAALGLSKS
jgi:hypothetical protein